MAKSTTKRARKDDHHDQVAKRPKFLYRERCIAGLYNACLDEEKRFRKKRVSLAAVRSRIKKVAEEYNDKLGPNSTKFINKNVDDLTRQGFFEKPDAGYIQFSPQAAKIIHSRSDSPKSVFQQDSPHPKALMRAFEQAGLRTKRRRLISDDEDEDEVQRELGLKKTNHELEASIKELRSQLKDLGQKYEELLHKQAQVEDEDEDEQADAHGEADDVFGNAPADTEMDFDEINDDGFGSDHDAEDETFSFVERQPSSRLRSPDLAPPSSSPVQAALVRRSSNRSFLQSTQTGPSQDLSSINLFPTRPGQALVAQRSFTGCNSGRITPAPSAGQRSPPTADQHDVDIDKEDSANEQLGQIREELEVEKEGARQLREVVRLLRLDKEREAETRLELAAKVDAMTAQKVIDDAAIAQLTERSQQLQIELGIALIGKDTTSRDLEAAKIQIIEKDATIFALQEAERVNQGTISEYKDLLQRQQSETKEMRAQFDVAMKDVHKLAEDTAGRLQEALDHLTSQAEHLTQRILEREDDIRLLRGQVVDLKASNEAHTAENFGLVLERDTLRAELGGAQELIKTGTAELASLNQVLTALEKERYLLLQEVEVVEDAQADLEDKLEGASERIYALDKQITGHVREVEDLRLALMDERDHLRELEQHVSAKDGEIDQQMKKVKEHQSNIQLLERRIVDLRAAFEESQNENETLEQRLEEVTMAKDEIVRVLTKMPGRDSPIRVPRSARASLAKSLAEDNDHDMLT